MVFLSLILHKKVVEKIVLTRFFFKISLLEVKKVIIISILFSEKLTMSTKFAAVSLIAFLLQSTDALRCRQCNGVTSLYSCTTSVDCSDDEECYMDKYVTNLHSGVYYGGCRATTTCQAGAVPHLPTGVQSVSCSKCCDDNSTNVECNVNLCGIMASVGSKANQCYFCDSDNFGSIGDVSDPASCTTLTTCQADEMCGVDDISLGGQMTHKYSCRNARICSFLMKRVLDDMIVCRQNPDPNFCGNVKRSSGMRVCTACCGDNMCNAGTCKDVMEHLYELRVNGTLDMNTLKETSSATGTIVG